MAYTVGACCVALPLCSALHYVALAVTNYAFANCALLLLQSSLSQVMLRHASCCCHVLAVCMHRHDWPYRAVLCGDMHWCRVLLSCHASVRCAYIHYCYPTNRVPSCVAMKVCYPHDNPAARVPAMRWAQFLFLGHGACAWACISQGWYLAPVLLSLGPFYNGWLFFLCNSTQHIGLHHGGGGGGNPTKQIADFRLSTRTFYLDNPVVRCWYWQVVPPSPRMHIFVYPHRYHRHAHLTSCAQPLPLPTASADVENCERPSQRRGCDRAPGLLGYVCSQIGMLLRVPLFLWHR